MRLRDTGSGFNEVKSGAGAPNAADEGFASLPRAGLAVRPNGRSLGIHMVGEPVGGEVTDNKEQGCGLPPTSSYQELFPKLLDDVTQAARSNRVCNFLGA